MRCIFSQSKQGAIYTQTNRLVPSAAPITFVTFLFIQQFHNVWRPQRRPAYFGYEDAFFSSFLGFLTCARVHLEIFIKESKSKFEGMCLPICGLLWEVTKPIICGRDAWRLRWRCAYLNGYWLFQDRKKPYRDLKVNWPTSIVHCWVTDTKRQLIVSRRTMRCVRYLRDRWCRKCRVFFCHAVQFLLSKKLPDIEN